MTTPARTPRATLALVLIGALALPAAHGLSAQSNDGPEVLTTVYGNLPAVTEMNEGPRIEGIISARQGQRLQVTAEDGTKTIITIDNATARFARDELDAARGRLSALIGEVVSDQTAERREACSAGDPGLRPAQTAPETRSFQRRARPTARFAAAARKTG
jgi:hypothetical protein